MEFYVIYLSILVYCYTQIFRKQQNLDTLKEVNPGNLTLFILYNLFAGIIVYFSAKGKEFGYLSSYIGMSLIYFGLMFMTCLVWRRKDEKFMNPFFLNKKWNLIGALGTLQYAVAVSFLHSIPNK